MTTKWGCFATPLPTHNIKAVLDNFGEDGWELVTVLPDPAGESHVGYFKRSKAD